MLKVTNLSISYKKINAVRNISFEVREGEIVSLIGSNGAGKTSTMRTISGLIKAKSGSILYEGKELIGASPAQIVSAGIVHVPEGRQVFSKLSVGENLELGGYLTRNKKIRQERMDYVFDLFPILKERIHQKAGSLSGGEQQMLAIGRARVTGSRLLLLDEPSLGLAPIIVEQVFEVIQTLRNNGMTILLVEQNAWDALQICDRAYIMESGEIVLSGTGQEVAENEDIRRIYLGGKETWVSSLHN
ncbi:MAG: ABC transporter ATP-binding protein [Parasporobacterium sp.]|nr:ABC transporter ATP-binding protein [Parasporobacterium sp.]